jgi:hypothetical protein
MGGCHQDGLPVHWVAVNIPSDTFNCIQKPETFSQKKPAAAPCTIVPRIVKSRPHLHQNAA